MKISLNTALTTAVIATGAWYKFLSPKILQINELALNCVGSNFPKDLDSYTLGKVVYLATNPFLRLLGVFPVDKIANGKCINELTNLGRYSLYSHIAFGIFAITASILTYKVAKATLSKIINTPVWSQKVVKQTASKQNIITTTNYLFGIIPTSKTIEYKDKKSSGFCTLL